MALPSAFSLDAAASLASPERFGFTPANLPLIAPASSRPAGSHMSSARASRVEAAEAAALELDLMQHRLKIEQMAFAVKEQAAKAQRMKQEADRESSQYLASDGARTPLLPDEDDVVDQFFELFKEQADALEAARPTAATAIKTQKPE
eukprot:10916186-Heterocapsa_arctica.AAC.1